MTVWKSSWVVGAHSCVIAACVLWNMYLLIWSFACGVRCVDLGLPGFHPLTLRLWIGCVVVPWMRPVSTCRSRSVFCMM